MLWPHVTAWELLQVATYAGVANPPQQHRLPFTQTLATNLLMTLT
jgi:hypothetical protein